MPPPFARFGDGGGHDNWGALPTSGSADNMFVPTAFAPTSLRVQSFLMLGWAANLLAAENIGGSLPGVIDKFINIITRACHGGAFCVISYG